MYRQVILMALLSSSAFGQGGPPFLTDDPATPGNKHWEINIGMIGDRNASEGTYSTPEIDIDYGVGDRIQLKYKVPFSLHESRDAGGSVVGGLGNSLFGVKYRFYEHKSRSQSDDSEPNFSLSVYPQLVLNNPTRSVARDVAEPGPQFLLPVETAVRAGPIQIIAEAGYWFTNKKMSDAWIRGLMVGHEFQNGTGLYLELHDESDVNEIGGKPRQRESTFGLGGRKAINRQGSVLVMGMVGRSLAGATPDNGQPQWITYVGVQFLMGKHDNTSKLF